MTVKRSTTDCLRRLKFELLSKLEAPSNRLSGSQLPPQLARRRGQIGDTPVELTTRRYTGPVLESLTFASISDADDRCRSLTLIGFPRPGSPVPILGVDLIAFRGALSLVALDYAPTSQSYWADVAAPILGEIRERALPPLKLRKRPDFTRDAFSELALIAASPRGTEDTACQAASSLFEAYLGLVKQSPSRPTQTGDRTVAQWCEAELRNRKEHDALARVFGPHFADAYLRFLFTPAGVSSSATPVHQPNNDHRSNHHVGH